MMSARKKSKKNKSFQIKTLIFLLISAFVMGWSVLPAYFTKRYDEQNPPSHPFVIPMGHGVNMSQPLLESHNLPTQDVDIENVWRKNVKFDYQSLDTEVKQLTSSLYELSFRSEIFTVSYRYRIDNANKKIIPVMYQTSGWIIWFYALGYLVVATVLITLVQWLIFWWRTSFAKK